MGQYHIVCNLDKKEYLHPHELGCGLKLWEQIDSHPGTNTALFALLACSNGRGGGDLPEHPLIGRWAGDRIAIVGDYAEATDLAPEHDAKNLYDLCQETGTGWTNISTEAVGFLEYAMGGTFQGDGWKDWVPNEAKPH